MNRPVRGGMLVSLVVLGAGAVLGGLYGGRVQAEATDADARLRAFGRVLALVEDNYVGPADAKVLVESAIQGMLRTLDPHSNYLTRDAFSDMRDEQRGKFFGLGIQITKRAPDQPITIIAPIDGTPASRAGLQAGDVIVRIEGDDTTEMSVQQAVRRLKGDRGTKVTITLQRPGEDAAFDVTLVRDEISPTSVPVAYMLRPDVGMVRISNFTASTTSELDAAIRSLKRQGMSRLLLDLRGNPGGLLDQAVSVAERFVPAGKLVVYTRGRIPGSDQDFLASRGVERLDVPVVVLVDRSTASASEIVSGAIQDHDRGLVVGEPTFGKGLVQRVIPLREGGALALTTAKYYTPAGRLIQRDYSDLDEYYIEAGADPAVGPDEADDVRREVFYTDSGRAVYGGGGITPDYIVRSERPHPLLSRLIRENHFFDYAVRYRAGHADLSPDFVVDDGVLGEFRAFLESRNFSLDEAAFEEHREAIALRLRADIAGVRWNEVERSRALAEADPMVRKALTLFEEASKLALAGERARLEKDRDAAEARSGGSPF